MGDRFRLSCPCSNRIVSTTVYLFRRCMHNPSVHWSEGMFLRPQHFQAWDRYWNGVLGQAIDWRVPYAYGMRSCAISHSALGAYQFQLDACQIVLRDGTLANLINPMRIDLRAAFAENTDVTVSFGFLNLRWEEKTRPPRFPAMRGV